MSATTIERPATAADPRTVENFMRGKCLAAYLVKTAEPHTDGDDASLNASYRDDGVPQVNFARPMLERLLAEPDLMDGFSAALSSMLAELGKPSGTGEGTAVLSYEGCTIHHGDDYDKFDPRTAPPLDEQVAAYGFDAAPRPVEIVAQSNIGIPISTQMEPTPSVGMESAARLCGQAANVLGMLAANYARSNSLWGLSFFADMVADAFLDVLDGYAPDGHQNASDHADGLLGLLGALEEEDYADGCFEAAQSLMKHAKEALDSEIARLDLLDRQQQEADHA